METVQIEFEPFIGEAARQFIVNGLDMRTGYPGIMTDLARWGAANVRKGLAARQCARGGYRS